MGRCTARRHQRFHRQWYSDTRTARELRTGSSQSRRDQLAQRAARFPHRSGQGNDAALVAPNIYSLPTGSITFGFTLPHTLQLTRGLSITIPNSTTGTLNASTYNVQARLYNWRIHTWDTASLSQDVLHTNDASYVGANGQVLLQVMPATTEALYVSKPYVTV